jgi:hypothetical protein
MLKDSERTATEGTRNAPKFHEGTAEVIGDVRLKNRLYTYRTNIGLVVGTATTVMFTLDHPVKDVWPYFKDFNLWQPNHYYTGVVGDMEGKSLGIGDFPDTSNVVHVYQVVRVIPEHLIVINQPVPDRIEDTGLPGVGGVRAGFHVFSLHDHGDTTEVAIIMEHASYASRSDESSEERALASWRAAGMLPEWHRKWRDEFIPELRLAVSERRRERKARD